MTCYSFRFGGDTLHVDYDEQVGCWVSTCNGQQHSSLDDAVRAECHANLDASGDEIDSSSHEPAVQQAIRAVEARLCS